MNNFSWKKVFKAVWYFIEKDRRRFLFAFFVLLGIFFYDLVPVYFVGKIVDFFTHYQKGESLRLFYFYVGFISSTWILASLIRLYSKKSLNIYGQHARARARIWGFERLTEFSLNWHNKENTGNKLQRIFTGADGVRNALNLLRKELLKLFANVFGVMVVFIFTDWKLAAFGFIYVTVFIYAEFALSRKVFELTNEFNQLNQSAGGVYVESANNMLSIKALGGEKGIIDRVFDKETLSRDISIKKANANNFKWRMLQFVNGIALGSFLLIVGFNYLSLVISLGTILVLYSYFDKLGKSLADVSDLHSDLLDVRSDIAQMMPIFEETEFIKTGNEIFPKTWDKIEIKNASMDYGSGQMGLANFSLELSKNTKTGIAGLSGSGKSTLAKIILGLYALKSGEFKIGNRDYYSISHKEILNNITVVLQETELFNLSLKENITMMRPIDPVLLAQAVEISELGEVVNRLPEGLESRIGEKGYMLSGGERQRLGIARAIYKNTPIVILDEATSSLDSETEGKIMEKLLKEYGENKTFLIIAHRLGTLKYTDHIAVMERGVIAEVGSYAELMENTASVFYRMNQEQKIPPSGSSSD